MRILFVNDDGYDSIGLHAVADLFKDHDICVVAPKLQQSAKSHAINIHDEFSYETMSGYDYPVCAVDAHPTDCAKLALTKLFVSPDIIISGINRGRNLGSDIMYSGTVGAAFEAAYYDLRGVALSLHNYTPTAEDYARCAAFVKNNFKTICAVDLPPHTIININFPKGEPRGVKVCKMSDTAAIDEDYAIDENRVCYYKFVKARPAENKSDQFYCSEGYITVTPLKMDMTDKTAITILKKADFKL